MNNVTLIGRLTRDPELRYTGSGKPVANFGLAVQDRDRTDFINCTAWGKTAENLKQYKNKGDQVAVVGRIHVSQYEKEGQKKSSFEVVASQVIFLANKKADSGSEYPDEAPF